MNSNQFCVCLTALPHVAQQTGGPRCGSKKARRTDPNHRLREPFPGKEPVPTGLGKWGAQQWKSGQQVGKAALEAQALRLADLAPPSSLTSPAAQLPAFRSFFSSFSSLSSVQLSFSNSSFQLFSFYLLFFSFYLLFFSFLKKLFPLGSSLSHSPNHPSIHPLSHSSDMNWVPILCLGPAA